MSIAVAVRIWSIQRSRIWIAQLLRKTASQPTASGPFLTTAIARNMPELPTDSINDKDKKKVPTCERK